MLRFYASVRHIYGGRIITIVGSGRTIVTTAIGETSDAIGEATKSRIGLGPRAGHQWPVIYFISDLDLSFLTSTPPASTCNGLEGSPGTISALLLPTSVSAGPHSQSGQERSSMPPPA